MPKVIKRNVSMYEEWEVVEAVSEHYGLDNISAALRFIVNDWQRRVEVQSLPNKRQTEDDSE